VQDADYAVLVQLAFFEFSTGAPHPLSTTHTVSLPPFSLPPLSNVHDASINAEILHDHVLIPVWNNSSCKVVVYLVSWKTGTMTLVSGFSEFCLVLNSHESLKLRSFPERSTTFRTVVVSIDSSLVSLIEDCENRLEICKLEFNPSPRLQTLCFLELPPLALGASQFFFGAYKEWVQTSKSYTRTRSSRGYHLPFYSSAIGTIALRFEYQLQRKPAYSYTLIINVAALVSVIPTDARKVPWEDWGPCSTHLFKVVTMQPTSLGPFWITEVGSPVVRQYDLRRTRYTQLMAGNKSSFQSKPPTVDSTNVFQYDIKTHLPYRDVMIENKELYESTYIRAEREWVVGVTFVVCGFVVGYSDVV